MIAAEGTRSHLVASKIKGLAFASLLPLFSVLLSSLASFATPTTARAEGDPVSVAVRGMEEFEGSADELRATVHHTVEFSCAQESRRVFVETPAKDRVVLEAVTVPATGERRWRLTDDATGWWIELREDSELHVELTTPYGYDVPLFDRRYFGEDHAATWVVATRGGEVASLESSLHDWHFASKLADVSPVPLKSPHTGS